jgi:hypothetical protein
MGKKDEPEKQSLQQNAPMAYKKRLPPLQSLQAMI